MSKPRIRAKFEADGKPTAGIKLALRLLNDEEQDAVELSPDVAREAIEALEGLEVRGPLRDLLHGAEELGGQVHSDATSGLQEVIQNAEDQGATNIRFGFRDYVRGAKLLIAHDGNPVELHDVLRMAWPALSSSREDADKIGRFGIGLKTLKQFGDRLAVHCPPLPGFEIQGVRIAQAKAARRIRDFWEPSERQTLFVVSLQDTRFDLAFFKDWLKRWDVSSLLFLRHLRNVTLVDLNSKKTVAMRGITVAKPRTVDLDLPRAIDAQQALVRAKGSSRAWTRYSIRYPRPEQLKATHKQVGDTVRLQIAVPRHPEEARLYVGLPLEEPSDLPFSLSAPFEPNVERTSLRDHNEMNEWLIAQIGDLTGAISVRRFTDQPKSGWCTVPLETEGAGESTWVRAQFRELVRRHRDLVLAKVRLTLPDGEEVRLGDLVYEDQELEGLLTSEDIDRLWNATSSDLGERRAVPRSWRDRGRWRSVLEDIEEAHPLYIWEALTILDWDDGEVDPRGAKWLVDLIYAATRAGEEHRLWEKRCIALAHNGGRLSPSEIATRGTLLVHSLPKKGLAATLALAKQIARPFRAHNEAGAAVRSWLHEHHVLQEKATDADALRVLAHADRDDPIDLRRRDAVIVRLRNSFDQLTAGEREEIGPGIGRNIAIRGFTFENGTKKPQLVCPAEAYLPSAIDKNEGWPTAAAKTPGIPWVDTRYRDTLRGPRGRGALVFLKALGAATAPRLREAADPWPDPNATPLVRRKLCEQHEQELAQFPYATGLADDWVSPDLEAVLDEIIRERNATIRHKRARALFLALDRAWDESYARQATVSAVRHYRTWIHEGDVSSTWVARLASLPWLTTRESKLHPAAPRELTVLTEAAFEIEGGHPEKYAAEIDAEHVDSPVVEALCIQGRPYASSIVERLETIRAGELRGISVSQVWADRCYQALASYAPGGPYADRSDLTPRQLQIRFSDRRGEGGLIRAEGEWLPPSRVRRDPYLDESLPRVADADALWDLLGVVTPTISDCIAVMKALAVRGEVNLSTEIRVYRHLKSLVSGRRRSKKQLASMPLRTYSGWKNRCKETVYAVGNPVLAEALGQHWPVWCPPLSLEELAPLVPLLGIHQLSELDFEASIPAHAAVTSHELQPEFAAAVGHLKDYLAVHHETLHDRLSCSRWEALEKAQVIVGSGWAIRVRGPRRRSLRLTVRAHLFVNPTRFCVPHEDEVGERDAGGQAIGGFFVGDEPGTADRSIIALAWAHAFQQRRKERDEIELLPADEAEDAPAPGNFDDFARTRRRRRARKRLPKPPMKPSPQEPPRELVDLDELDLASVKGTFLEAKRRGSLRVSARTKLKQPKRRPRQKKPAERKTRAGQRLYTETDREEAAYRIIEATLRDTRGLVLEDTRDQGAVGADAVDREQDIWIELKTHGQEPADTLRLEPSQALRAEEKRARYWLVVVWNLERPRTPEYVVIPDPLRRLDTYLARGLRLTGVGALVEQTAAEKSA